MMSLLVESEKTIALDTNTAFKSVWVTNSLDGDSMRQFRNKMTAKPPPKTVKKVIRSLIPPKSIKRDKNIEGSELFDGKEIEEEKEEDENEGEGEIDADQLLQALTGDIPVELATEKETQECNAVTGSSVSLVGITESDQINKDAKFLDEIKKVFDEYETSVQFTTARNQVENAYRSAQNSLKKRSEKNSA